MNAPATQLDSLEQLMVRLDESRAITDDLFRIVSTEALYDRPIPARHRIVFYIGHLEAFDWNLLAGHGLGLGPAHHEYDRLFAFGIDPVNGGLPMDQPWDWPRLPEVGAYTLHVRQELERILRGGSQGAASSWQYPLETILNVAIEHRLMHAETLAYMLHQLPLGRKIPPPNYRRVGSNVRGATLQPRMVDVPAGAVTLGIPHQNEVFGWDNEFKINSVEVPAFAIDAYKVTNGDFLAFIRAGGYDDPNYWDGADWAWVQERNIRHPGFWSERQDRWFYQAMFEEVPLPLDWPVYVSQAEASAYARYAGKSLPTEAQFHRAAYATAEHTERAFPWGEAAPTAEHGNFDFHRWDPAPVGSYPGGRSALGAEDMLGNGWEWTRSTFAPFPGFEPFPFYRGYSADFFDGKHFVMKGGSPRTAACMLRRSFRNWFQAHYPFVYTSFRCVSN